MKKIKSKTEDVNKNKSFLFALLIRSKKMNYLFLFFIFLLIFITCISVTNPIKINSSSNSMNIFLNWISYLFGIIIWIFIICGFIHFCSFIKQTYLLRKYWRNIDSFLEAKGIYIYSPIYMELYKILVNESEYEIKKELIDSLLNKLENQNLDKLGVK